MSQGTHSFTGGLSKAGVEHEALGSKTLSEIDLKITSKIFQKSEKTNLQNDLQNDLKTKPAVKIGEDW